MTVVQLHAKLCAGKRFYYHAFNFYFFLTGLLFLYHLPLQPPLQHIAAPNELIPSLNSIPFCRTSPKQGFTGSQGQSQFRDLCSVRSSRCLALRMAFFLARRRSSLLETYHRFLRSVVNTPLRVTSLRNRLSRFSCDSFGPKTTVGTWYVTSFLTVTQTPCWACSRDLPIQRKTRLLSEKEPEREKTELA